MWDKELRVAALQETLIREAIAARIASHHIEVDEIQLLADALTSAVNSHTYYLDKVKGAADGNK